MYPWSTDDPVSVRVNGTWYDAVYVAERADGRHEVDLTVARAYSALYGAANRFAGDQDVTRVTVPYHATGDDGIDSIKDR